MATEKLPEFEFHPAPFSSRALEDSTHPCACCGKSRGVLYIGPVYCVEEVDGVCPWCIADGSAAEKWDAEFTDGSFFDSWGDRIDLGSDFHETVFRRTPGPAGGLQSIRWWVHCERPAQFLRIVDDQVMFRCGACGETYQYTDPD